MGNSSPRHYDDGGRPPTTQWRTEEWVWVPFEVDRRYDGLRVDRYLAQRLSAYSRARVQSMLNECRVMRAEQRLKPSTKVHGGDKRLIAYPRQREAPLPADASVPILYEDEDLVVVDKPANVLSHPTDKILNHTVLGILKQSRPDLKKLHLMHRLDRETSGVLALAKTKKAASTWAKAMAARQIHKEYIALVHGVPSEPTGLIDWPIGRQGGTIKVRQWVNVPGAVSARTRYRVLSSTTLTRTLSLLGRGPGVRSCEKIDSVAPVAVDRGPEVDGERLGPGLRIAGPTNFSQLLREGFSVVRAYPETGRMHQIRVHLAALGHPLLGDVLYDGDGSLYMKMTRFQLTPEERQSLGFSRVALHAERLTFPHPIHGQRLSITSPLPIDMSDFLQTHGLTLTHQSTS